MKRIIKFRAWHKETKVMLNIWPYEWNKGVFAGTSKENRFFNNEFELTPDGLSCNRIKGKSVFFTLDGAIIGLVPISETVTQTVDYSDEYEIMQFTGLLDKNGKDIYEGDIISNPYNDDRLSVKYGMFNDNHENHPDSQSIGFYTSHRCGLGFNIDGEMVLEVIGNVFEDPELL